MGRDGGLCDAVGDGEPVTLRKTYYEKWSVKRGKRGRHL